MGFRVRWYVRSNLREIYHLCELRTTPQGHPDYRLIAQEMFRRVQEVHPRLAGYARFVDLGPGDDLERRQPARRPEEKREHSTPERDTIDALPKKGRGESRLTQCGSCAARNRWRRRSAL